MTTTPCGPAAGGRTAPCAPVAGGFAKSAQRLRRRRRVALVRAAPPSSTPRPRLRHTRPRLLELGRVQHHDLNRLGRCQVKARRTLHRLAGADADGGVGRKRTRHQHVQIVPFGADSVGGAVLLTGADGLLGGPPATVPTGFAPGDARGRILVLGIETVETHGLCRDEGVGSSEVAGVGRATEAGHAAIVGA